MILVIGMTGIGYAGLDDSNAEEGLSASPAFEEDGLDGHFTHENGGPRFCTEMGHIAISAEEPGLNSDENSAVSEHPSEHPCEHHPDETGSVIDTSN